MPHGYNGKILRVDLRINDIKIEEPPEKIYRGFLGGGALALYYLTKEMKPGIDPLGPENMLIFTTSVATGTPGMGFSRFTAAAKSPITGYFGEAEAGGWWGPELKFSGFDGIIIRGKSDRPVYLWIHNGKAELRDASHLWGHFALETQNMIRKELGDEKVRVALIGPGGEKLVKFACILNELRHANGRTGLGSVMGAKNLKAIAVRGDKSMSLNDPKAVREIVREVKETYKKNPLPMSELGTAWFVLPLSLAGLLPTRNFITGSFDKAECISAEVMKDTILFKRGTCYRCPVSCKRDVKVDVPFNVDPIYGGPEYETIAALGSLCCIADLKAIALANQLCGAYTLDTISTGMTIAFAMECFEKGIITTKDTGGIKLQFGNAESMLQMVELIGKREGFGNLLAEGVKVAAERIGKDATKYAMHVKGLPVPMHDPRGKVGVALQYALSPTGADHCEAPHDRVFESETGLNPLMPLGIIEPVSSFDLGSRKVRIFVYLQQLFNMYNSIGICNFTVHPMGPMSLNYLVNYANAVTGWNTSLWELMKVGERHTNMARIFNLREGLTSKDDSLPNRFFQPLEGGPLEGKKIDPQELQLALKTYYEMMGWNEAGIPLRGKLEELSLEWVTR
jgi:aldehyde:ferredoxin oxidoreductase